MNYPNIATFKDLPLDELMKQGATAGPPEIERAVRFELMRREHLLAVKNAEAQERATFAQEQNVNYASTSAEQAESAARSAYDSAKATIETAKYTKENAKYMKWSVYVLAAGSLVTAITSIIGLLPKGH